MSSDSHDDPAADARLYVPHPEGWSVHVKTGSERYYCYTKAPGDEHFHLIVNGEIYLERGAERLCLECCLRSGAITRNRLFWQQGPRRKQGGLI